MICRLPPICSCCQGKRFVYFEVWQHSYGGRRPDTPTGQTPFEAGRPGSDVRTYLATFRPEKSAWASPTARCVAVSMRVCASCGACQPFIDPSTLQYLMEDDPEQQAHYVDHDQHGGSSPFR